MKAFVMLSTALGAAFVITAVLSACEDDAAVAPASLPEAATFDVGTPRDGPSPEGEALVDAGVPVDLSTIEWKLFASLPADGVRAGSECDVAVDADDHVLVTFGEAADAYGAPRSLTVFRHDGVAWSALGGAPLVADSGSLATWPRLAAAADGAIYVAFNHEGPHVRRFAAGSWTALPAPGLSRLWGVTVDATGAPAVIGDAPGEARRLTRFDGAAWGAPTSPLADLDAGGGVLVRGVLAIAPGPDASIAALVRTTTSKLGAFTLAGTLWSPLGPELADGAEYPELASSTGGHLAAAWSADNVYAARFDPDAQSFVPLGGALGDAGARYAVSAIDSFDRPFVAWRTPGQPIKVSAFESGAWRALPDPSTGAGTLPAIALDRRGLPVVCWEVSREAGSASEIIVARAVAK